MFSVCLWLFFFAKMWCSRRYLLSHQAQRIWNPWRFLLKETQLAKERKKNGKCLENDQIRIKKTASQIFKFFSSPFYLQTCLQWRSSKQLKYLKSIKCYSEIDFLSSDEGGSCRMRVKEDVEEDTIRLSEWRSAGREKMLWGKEAGYLLEEKER